MAAEGFDKKVIAAAFKEGGKKGQDLIGMADMGGIKFFNVAIDQAQGEWELLEQTMQGANVVVDDSAEVGVFPLLFTLLPYLKLMLGVSHSS